MTANRLNRNVHYWATLLVAFPLLIIIGSGLLLQVKKQSSWVQPAERQGTGTVPRTDLEGILDAVRSDSSTDVGDWSDIDRIDVRPAKGVAKVRLMSGWEVQVDLGTGAVLQSAYRRSDLIESIHDGSFFGGDVVKLGIFLPVGIVLLAMWISGVWMFWLPFSARRAKQRRSGPGNSARSPAPRRRVKLPPAGGKKTLP